MIGIKKLSRLSLLVSAFVLAGCGGQSNDGSTPVVPPVVPPIDPMPMLAMDGFSTVTPDVEAFIDLRPFLRGNDVRITDIQADEDNALCGVPTVKGLGVNVQVKNGAFCQFTYTATQTGAPQARASMNVLATKAAEPSLPPISQAIVTGSGNATFDLQTLLGGSWKGTYKLNADSVQVQGMEGNVGSETVTSNSIVFTPPDLSGWNRIVFILDDTAAPSESVMGVIYVTISEEVNQPPIIPIPNYPYQFVTTPFDKKVSAKDVGCSEVGASGSGGSCSADTVAAAMGSARTVFWENLHGRQNITLPRGEKFYDTTVTVRNHDLPATTVWDEESGEVAAFVPKWTGQRDFRNFNGYWWASNGIGPVGDDRVYASDTLKVDLTKLNGLRIKDPEGHDWQLISVHSWTADVKAFDPDSVSNKAFNFTASSVGEHFVNYIVADHYGGYSSGLIRINVSAKEITPTWKSLVAAGNTYTAPQTYNQAIQGGFKVSAVWDAGVSNTVAGYQQQVANSYCSSIGLLPTVNDMNVLRDIYLTGDTVTGELAKWPIQQRYLVKSGGGVTTYDLASGSTQAYDNTKPSYVTCLENRNMVMKMTNYTVVANGQQVSIADVIMPQPDDTFTINRVEGTLSELDTNLRLGDQVGSTTPVTTFSTKAGTYRFSVTDDSDRFSVLTSPTISYIGDRETGLFSAETGLVVTSNGAVGDGVSENIVTATLTDVNGNVVGGEAISVFVTENGTENNSVEYTLSPRSGKTDQKGQLEIKLTNTEMETVDVKVSYTRPDGLVEESTTVQLNYSADSYPCGGVAGNYDCLPIQEQKNKKGWLFTPTMSSDFAVTNGLLDKIKGAQVITVPNGTFSIVAIERWEASRRQQCQVLSDIRFSGRTNWRVAYGNEMSDFTYSNMPVPRDVRYSWPGFSSGSSDSIFVSYQPNPAVHEQPWHTVQTWSLDLSRWQWHQGIHTDAYYAVSHMCVSEP
ncbi:Ig-like domain-containing protein [Vibrio sp. B172a]|uniref:Ig-like domain-containing protein n=1 Tax=Vibrio sp. B172a TaxID=2835790 RepID=UPI002552D74B|nr:Ig-like domain-containing protein [Vibrio sp. B172a]MDK9782321.1 Ig-like domain-containing protein [Vibrio sp. B172a]